MVQRSFIHEHTIHHQDFEPTGAIKLLGVVNLLDIVLKVFPFVKTMVLKFYSNLTNRMGDPTSLDFQTVCIWGHTSSYQVLSNTTLVALTPLNPFPSPLFSILSLP